MATCISTNSLPSIQNAQLYSIILDYIDKNVIPKDQKEKARSNENAAPDVASWFIRPVAK